MSVCSNHTQKPLHKSPKGAWILLHGSQRFVWRVFVAARASTLMLLVFIFFFFYQNSFNDWKSNKMFVNLRHDAISGIWHGGWGWQGTILKEAFQDKTETSILTQVERPQMSPSTLPCFLNCYWKKKFYLNSGPRPLGLKTILCTPHRAQVKFIQTISAATVWITLSFPFFP